MSKVCLINTAATVDSNDVAYNETLSSAAADPTRTKPLRLLSGEGLVEPVAFEFIHSGNAGDALELNWWFEFWADDVKASLQSPPSNRTLAGLQSATPWAREVTEEVGAGGAIRHNDVIRDMTLDIATGDVGAARVVEQTFRMPWVRLAMYGDAALAANAALRVVAHVGGHSEADYLDGSTPYVYNASINVA